ncbi:MAG: DUF4230 domain-containing protein [Chloroflexota bacterium]
MQQPEINNTTSPSPEGRSIWMWLLAGAGGCLGITLLVMLIAAFVTARSITGGIALLGEWIEPPPPQGSIRQSQTIVTQIRPLGQLVSTEGSFAKADISVSILQGRFASCNHRANHVASATIAAGIDLFEVNENSVTYDALTDTYTVTVPKPVITSCSVDFIDQYERNVNIPTCIVDWDDARQLAQYEALVEMRQDAVNGGLLETAERQTDFALSSFITAITGSNVVVQFTEGDLTDEEIFAGCTAVPPRDWVEQDGAWIRVR